MAREFLTDEQVEQEITRLRSSEAVKLARKEVSIKYRRRQQMYQLRNFEKRGMELMESGVNMDNIETVLFGDPVDLDI